MTNKRAEPLKVVEIRGFARFTREKLIGKDADKSINMVKALDILSFNLSRYGFNYAVLPDDDPIFEKNEEAKTDITSGDIYFKQSVIEQAAHKKCCRANFTIAHEIGHFLLHRVLYPISFSRTTSPARFRIFEDPEWQADTFASELLMPYDECLRLTPTEIRRKYHVTMSAAETRYNKIHKK